jgi:hypothetical protein
VELHIDSMVVVRAITCNGGGKNERRALVDKIRRLINLDWAVVVKYSDCEAN